MPTMPTMRFLLLLAILAGFSACKSSDGDPPAAFDRKAMLTNYADNLIVPAFQTLAVRTGALNAAVQTLVDQPDADRLLAAQSAWKDAFLAWQNANAFNFGPAGEEGVRKSLAEEIGTFPASPGKIQQFISAGDTSFQNFDRDTRGFLALEYLLFNGDAPQVLAQLAQPSQAAYLRAVAGNLHAQAVAVATEWPSYRTEFVNNSGTDVGSSASVLYNEFVHSYEQLKNFKLGLPLGKRVGQTATEPEKVEAFYSGHSLPALEAHFEALVRLWEGRASNGADGSGFKEYLASVEGGPALILSTEAQIAAIRLQFAQLNDSDRLSDLIQTNPAGLDPLFNALTQHTRFFKSDMSSLLGISITYSSGDGD
jgi:predicted lipoprotein